MQFCNVMGNKDESTLRQNISQERNTQFGAIKLLVDPQLRLSSWLSNIKNNVLAAVDSRHTNSV